MDPLPPDRAPSTPPRPDPPRPTILLPDAPALALGLTHAAWLTNEGEIEMLDLVEATRRARRTPPFLCHGRAIARRLRTPTFAAFDLLELFAFVRPGRFCLPTPRGVAAAVDLAPPRRAEDEALSLAEAARALLTELAQSNGGDADAIAIADAMERGGWSWGAAVRAALGEPPQGAPAPAGLAIWRRLPEWSEFAPEGAPGNEPVAPAEARRRLAELLGDAAEARPQQSDYADAATPAFAPRERPQQPNAVLAEAGTGVGKTLGYIAPASLWAEKNGGAVWIATYTRNLQHQIDGELDRLYPDPSQKARRVVLRKGRENYLCLLNFEEAVAGATLRAADAVPLGLIARWLQHTRDGDIVGGGDFPGWLADVLGRGRSLGLTDRRGECIHSACSHYHKCFIEKSVRRARRARIVVANHALVMVQAALGGLDDNNLPTRYVFDEGHHLFDAADGAFSLALSGQETADLRRWLLGVEAGGRGRARGLRRRLEELIAGDPDAEEAMGQILMAARILPAEGWQKRIAEERPQQAAEAFLAILRQQVLARAADGREGSYGIETAARPPVEALLPAAQALEAALSRIETPMGTIARRLTARLEEEAAELETATRLRIEAMVRSLTRRGTVQIGGWRRMLRDLAAPQPLEFIDWIALERYDGLEQDVGLHRHYVDPTLPFIEAVAKPAHGVLVTSATLTDGSGDPLEDWRVAEARTGARHLDVPAFRARIPSPFAYPEQTRIFVVTDVRRDDAGQVAGAYRALFLAAGGGALGLFTAIARLRAVRERIAAPLEEAGLMLLAQHVDGMDTGTLVDIFRAEEDSCLLGTDAVRDGVDVPGRSLRLIVFDRVPWPRPDILHKARRNAFGGARYDDMLTRLRLKQAYGRLIRRATDTGVFVLLDPAFPSRLAGAFPPGVAIERIGLKEAVERTAAFLRK